MVRRKLTAGKYKTPHPMELVAYVTIDMLPDDVWIPRYEQRLTDMLDGAVFRRLWVFVAAARNDPGRIRFVYPPL